MGINEEGMRLNDMLPEEMTSEDLMYEIYVRQSIEASLSDSEAGRVKDVSRRQIYVRAGFLNRSISN